MMDVGANFGLFTIIAARAVGPSGGVHAFEPAPEEYRKLRRNLAVNRFRNVKANAVAAGARPGVAILNVYHSGWGAYNSIGPSEDPAVPATPISVPITSLDTYVGEHGIEQLDFLKVDVEGAERDVLTGARDVLSRLRPVIMCEVDERRTLPLGYAVSELLTLVEGFGYRWCQISADGALRPAQEREQRHYNMVAVPHEATASLRDQGLYVEGRP